MTEQRSAAASSTSQKWRFSGCVKLCASIKIRGILTGNASLCVVVKRCMPYKTETKE